MPGALIWKPELSWPDDRIHVCGDGRDAADPNGPAGPPAQAGDDRVTAGVTDVDDTARRIGWTTMALDVIVRSGFTLPLRLRN